MTSSMHSLQMRHQNPKYSSYQQHQHHQQQQQQQHTSHHSYTSPADYSPNYYHHHHHHQNQTTTPPTLLHNSQTPQLSALLSSSNSSLSSSSSYQPTIPSNFQTPSPTPNNTNNATTPPPSSRAQRLISYRQNRSTTNNKNSTNPQQMTTNSSPMNYSNSRMRQTPTNWTKSPTESAYSYSEFTSNSNSNSQSPPYSDNRNICDTMSNNHLFEMTEHANSHSHRDATGYNNNNNSNNNNNFSTNQNATNSSCSSYVTSTTSTSLPPLIQPDDVIYCDSKPYTTNNSVRVPQESLSSSLNDSRLRHGSLKRNYEHCADASMDYGNEATNNYNNNNSNNNNNNISHYDNVDDNDDDKDFDADYISDDCLLIENQNDIENSPKKMKFSSLSSPSPSSSPPPPSLSLSPSPLLTSPSSPPDISTSSSPNTKSTPCKNTDKINTNNEKKNKNIDKNNASNDKNNKNNSNTNTTRAPFLPPCKICGAKASGFHYGVNSCEACKGFFRRVLKRPVVFFCTKNNSCNLKRNKRSSCRFCRYKRCLSLGMSKEAIKTGRYSHQKRTQDIMAVKYLQTYNDNENDYFEMDEILEKLLVSHQSNIVSSARFQDSYLYKKQKDYHKLFLAHKKTVSETAATASANTDINQINENVAKSSLEYNNPSDSNPDLSSSSNHQPSKLERILLNIPLANDTTNTNTINSTNGNSEQQLSPEKSVSPAASLSSFDSGFSDYSGHSDEESSALLLLRSTTTHQDNNSIISTSESQTQSQSHVICSNSSSSSPSSPSSSSLSSSSSLLQQSCSSNTPSHSVDYLNDSDSEILEEILKEFKQQQPQPSLSSLTSVADLSTDKHQHNNLQLQSRNEHENKMKNEIDNDKTLIESGNDDNPGLDLRTENVIQRERDNSNSSNTNSNNQNEEGCNSNSNTDTTTTAAGDDDADNKSPLLIKNTPQDGDKEKDDNNDNKTNISSEFRSSRSSSRRRSRDVLEEEECSKVIKTEIITELELEPTIDQSSTNTTTTTTTIKSNCDNKSSKAATTSTNNNSSNSNIKQKLKFPETTTKTTTNTTTTTTMTGCGQKEKDDNHLSRAGDCVNGYVNFAKIIPGFTSIPHQDQAVLLRHAWDEIWILGAYRGFNCELGVAVMPSGVVFHSEEMEQSWGREYARLAFDLADILKKSGVTEEMLVLLKAICVISPDRCELQDKEKAEKAHWLLIRCLINHLDTAMPKPDNMTFPGLVSILTSLRNLSELAQAHLSQGILDLKTDGLRRNILSEPVTPF